mmetsp:Transcript_22571/g.63930  ORF Transcript_22571/g.63930 Transcript_22571/m.63930 type:complete len:205 (+) Transcript_22571:5531-6145(+)
MICLGFDIPPFRFAVRCCDFTGWKHALELTLLQLLMLLVMMMKSGRSAVAVVSFALNVMRGRFQGSFFGLVYVMFRRRHDSEVRYGMMVRLERAVLIGDMIIVCGIIMVVIVLLLLFGVVHLAVAVFGCSLAAYMLAVDRFSDPLRSLHFFSVVVVHVDISKVFHERNKRLGRIDSLRTLTMLHEMFLAPIMLPMLVGLFVLNE